jgi:hypothetical protein
VHLAVVALRVAAALPVVPVDAAEEVLPRAVVLALDQIAGALPALRRVGRVAPRRARVLALAGGELEEERRRGDLLVALGQLDDLLELGVDLVAEQEMIVALERLVVVAGREQDAVDVELGEERTHLLDLLDGGLAEHGRVRAHPVAEPLPSLMAAIALSNTPALSTT